MWVSELITWIFGSVNGKQWVLVEHVSSDLSQMVILRGMKSVEGAVCFMNFRKEFGCLGLDDV